MHAPFLTSYLGIQLGTASGMAPVRMAPADGHPQCMILAWSFAARLSMLAACCLRLASWCNRELQTHPNLGPLHLDKKKKAERRG